uniref:AB hydrolase-1 domain-containing protein n=1 Tax=Leersia perrieri TaxID=77586 RepID=A0A0D9WDF7_9ORYZ
MNATVLGGAGGETTATVVLAHGYGGSRRIWDDVAPSLAKTFRVVVFDWSFSGEVTVDNDAAVDDEMGCSYFDFAGELVAMMDDLSLSDTVFVGHSMSGMIGCIASVSRPDLFRRLVLVGASPRYINGDEGDDYVGGFDRGEVDAMLAAIEADFAAWAPAFAEVVVGGEPAAAVARFAKQLGRMRPGTALRVMRAVLTCDVRGVLRDVAAPCTVVHCERDAVAPLDVALYLRRALASGAGGEGAEVVVMESVGHFPQLTAPVEFVRVVESIVLGDQ